MIYLPLIKMNKVIICIILFVLNTACTNNTVQATPVQSVLITLDDMRPDDMKYMPRLQRLVNNKGIEVDKAFVTCPLCCPSRASLMTGLLPEHNGVISNGSTLSIPTIFQILKEQKPRVRTGTIGKYLNTSDGEYRPEFDFWSVYAGGMVYEWANFRQNVNGTWYDVKEYISDFYLKQAKEFADKYKNDPYLLYLHFTAPHFPAQTPKSFDYSCKNIRVPEDFNKIDPTGPAYFTQLPLKDNKKTRLAICKRAGSLAYIDNILPKFIRELKKRGVSVIVISDNGFLVGEFRHYSKSLPYEQVIRSPMLTFNHTIDPKRLTSFNDIVKEYYKLFGLKETIYKLDGLDFSTYRKSLKIEHFVHVEDKLPFVATVNKSFINVVYETGEKQRITLK